MPDPSATDPVAGKIADRDGIHKDAPKAAQELRNFAQGHPIPVPWISLAGSLARREG